MKQTLLYIALILIGFSAMDSQAASDKKEQNLFNANEGSHTFEGLTFDAANRVAKKCTNRFEQEYVKTNGKPSGYKWMDSRIVEVKDKQGNALSIGDNYIGDSLRYKIVSKVDVVDEFDDKLLGTHDCILAETGTQFYLVAETMNFTLVNEEKVTDKVGFDFTKLTNLEEATLFNECLNIRQENKYTERSDKIQYDFQRIKDIGVIEKFMSIDYFKNPKINYSLNSKWNSINDSGEKMASNISCVLSYHNNKFRLESYVATQWGPISNKELKLNLNDNNSELMMEKTYKTPTTLQMNDYFEACTFTVNKYTSSINGKIIHYKNLTWNERMDLQAYTIFKGRKLLKIKNGRPYRKDDGIFILKAVGNTIDKELNPIAIQCAFKDTKYIPGNINSIDLLLVVTSGGDKK